MLLLLLLLLLSLRSVVQVDIDEKTGETSRWLGIIVRFGGPFVQISAMVKPPIIAQQHIAAAAEVLTKRNSRPSIEASIHVSNTCIQR